MKHPIRLLAVLLPVLLAACATVAPYQPVKDGVGYADLKLESNRYRVSYYGNYGTSRETVENYILYRAAEVTLAHRYDYFTLVEQSLEGQPDYTDLGYGLYGRFGAYGIGTGGALGLGMATGTPIRTSYQGYADIVMFHGKKPANNVRAYNARKLKDNLEPLITRPPP